MTTTTATPAAVWLRVSTDHQEADNQIPDVERFCAHHGYQVTRTFRMSDSAWRDGTGGPEYQRELKAMLDAAYRGEFSVLVVWALDRITRLGAEDLLRLVRQLRERGCVLVSVQETWLNGSPEVQDILLAFAGWKDQQESKRRSARIRAGLERRRQEGKPVGGRKPGAKDKRPRKRRAA
jgi:DNA invertase Pin-like site-specific DNA recombinase